jgi:serine/threonine protein kinase
MATAGYCVCEFARRYGVRQVQHHAPDRKGGMGEVYEADDTDKGRTVALKILAEEYSNNASFRTRFQRESRAAAILQEPHVIPILSRCYTAARLTVVPHMVHAISERN